MILTTLTATLGPGVAFAYIGPGAGITAIGSILALLLGILLAIIGFIWYPLKRFMRSRTQKKDNNKLLNQGDTDIPEENKDT